MVGFTDDVVGLCVGMCGLLLRDVDGIAQGQIELGFVVFAAVFPVTP
jgi:hypothetical protein